jgi:heme-degrading monooxygenase HmoA
MFVILSEVTVKQGQEEQALQFYQQPSGMERAPGFRGVDFLQAVGGESQDGARFIGYTRWESREHFQAWMGSEAYRQAASGGMPDFILQHKVTLCHWVAGIQAASMNDKE